MAHTSDDAVDRTLWRNSIRRFAQWLTGVVLLVALLLLLGTRVFYAVPSVVFGSFYALSPAILWLKISALVFGILLLALVGSQLSVGRLLVYLVYTLSLVLLPSANDLLLLFLIVELQSFCLFVLLSQQLASSYVVEANIKYFVFSAAFSAVFVLGLALVYGLTGLTTLSDIRLYLQLLESANVSTWLPALLFVYAPLLFKLGVWPFHQWVPAVYDGVTHWNMLLLSTAAKLPVFFIAFVVFDLAAVAFPTYVIFFICGVASCSMLVGAIGALRATILKKFFAYTSINTFGFLLFLYLPVRFAPVYCSFEVLLSYLWVYAAAVIVFFIIVSQRFHVFSADRTPPTGGVRSGLLFITDLVILRRDGSYFLSALSALALFVMAGLPPFLLFVLKFSFVLHFVAVLWNAGFLASVVLVVSAFMVANTVAIFYYIRLIKILFFDESTPPLFYSRPLSVGPAWVLAVLAAILVSLPLGWLILT